MAAKMYYNHVHPGIWTPKLRDLRSSAPNAFALYLYVLTCRQRKSEGLFQLQPVIAAADLGLTTEEISEALADLEQIGFVVYDHESEVILDRTALDFYEPRGHNQVQGAINQIANLPRCQMLRHKLWELAMARCSDFAESLEESFPGVSTPPETEQGDSEGIRRGFVEGSKVASKEHENREPSTEDESESDTKLDIDSRPASVTDIARAFGAEFAGGGHS